MREGEKEEEDGEEKEEKRRTRQPPVLSTVPMLQYPPVLGGLLAGWLAFEAREGSRCRQGGNEMLQHKHTSCSEQQAGLSGDGGKERKSATHSLL